MLQDTQSLIGSPSTRIAPHIIGAEDDDFGTEHEQVMTSFLKIKQSNYLFSEMFDFLQKMHTFWRIKI